MSSTTQAPSKERIFALVGNPNCGKTTIFNALTGMRQKVANYPGVTVERKEGWFLDQHGQKQRILDLPGAYSLNATSPDEEILRDVILGRREDTPKPDVVVCVVDASNAERHFFLATQIMELGIPTIVVLNMTDIAKTKGIEFDPQKLSDSLGVPVILSNASAREGIPQLRVELSNAELKASKHRVPLPEELLAKLQKSEEPEDVHFLYEPNHPDHEFDEEWQDKLVALRYGAVRELFRDVSYKIDEGARNPTEEIDRFALHPVFGPILGLGIMVGIFYLIFSFASIPMDAIDATFAWLGEQVGNFMPEGDLRDLITDGIIAGVGGVVIFLPQILILFFFIGLMEDTGYLSRIAFMMDRLMSWVGLSGKSFLPLLSSYACAVPGIMGARTIESPKDRLITILVAPLTSCSARLPVYLLLIPAMAPNLSPLQKTGAMLGLYVLGTAGVFLFAAIFNKVFKRESSTLAVMELPTYKRPSLQSIGLQMWERGKIFLRRAGTVILGISIILWALETYPKTSDDPTEQLANSFAGKVGHAIEPLIEPLGYDWKIGIGLVTSFAAREVFVSAMAVTYHVEEGDDDDSTMQALLAKIQDAKRRDGTPVFTPLTCLSLLVFYVFAMQCMSTVAIVKRETNSWRWPLFQIGYMTAAAWIAAFMVYQGGKLLGFT